MGLLRDRAVRVVWAAEMVSALGDRFFTLALMWIALEKAGPVAMGLVVIVESVPHLLVGVFGRRLLTQFASFRALAIVEVAQVAVVAAVPWLWHAAGLAGVLGVLVVIGTADAVTDPSLRALVPGLVAPGRTQAMSGLLDLTGRWTWVLGPGAAAGLLAVMAPAQLFWIDAATFAVSGLAFAWLGRSIRRTGAGRREESLNTGEESGRPPAPALARRVLAARPRVACALSVEMVGEFCATVATIGIPVWLAGRLHAGPGAYGLMLTALGAGMLAGNLVAGHVRARGWWLPVACGAWVLRGAALAGFAVTATVGQVAALAAVVGALAPLSEITLTARIARLPEAERLRLFGVEEAGLHATGMASMLVLPVLIAAAPATMFTLAGAVTVIAAGGAWLVASLLVRRRALRPAAQS